MFRAENKMQLYMIDKHNATIILKLANKVGIKKSTLSPYHVHIIIKALLLSLF